MVGILYNDIYSCVSNNGNWSEWFQVHRSNRQGCPISSLLFTVTAEVLALSLRQDSDIQGIKIKDNMMLMTQYADDMWLALKPSNE